MAKELSIASLLEDEYQDLRLFYNDSVDAISEAINSQDERTKEFVELAGSPRKATDLARKPALIKQHKRFTCIKSAPLENASDFQGEFTTDKRTRSWLYCLDEDMSYYQKFIDDGHKVHSVVSSDDRLESDLAWIDEPVQNIADVESK